MLIKRIQLFNFCVIALCIILTCCSNTSSKTIEWPADFTNYSDTEKASFLMREFSADSLAVIICKSALGELGEEKKLKDLRSSLIYIVESYNDSSLQIFNQTLQNFIDTVKIKTRFKIYSLAADGKEIRLGYHLGLEYLDSIKENKMNPDEVISNILLFSEIYDDPSKYNDLLQGFSIAVKPERAGNEGIEIYDKIKRLKHQEKI